jgi:predicted RNA-binding protein YlxR (DUF448 family)
MLRFVRGPEGQLVFDASRKLPGRGVNVCPRTSCVRRAVDRELFSRGLRSAVARTDAAAVISDIHHALERRLVTLLQASIGARRCTLGRDLTELSLASGKASLVGCARDAAGAPTMEKLARRNGVRSVRLPDRSTVGGWVARDMVGYLAIEDRGLGDAVSGVIETLEGLDWMREAARPEDGAANA